MFDFVKLKGWPRGTAGPRPMRTRRLEHLARFAPRKTFYFSVPIQLSCPAFDIASPLNERTGNQEQQAAYGGLSYA